MRTLLFGTTYVDTLEKRAIQNLWFRMAERCRGVDAMIVDSASPMLPQIPSSVWYHSFGDNIGHLSKGGRDGWGRAFCRGLREAIDLDYDYAVHVECDAVCRLDVAAEVEDMEASGDCVRTAPVSSMTSWPETGLIFFSVDWLEESRFIERYDWEHRAKMPEPERVVRDLCGTDLRLMGWRAMRDDFHELTVDNLDERHLDWLTHAPLRVMEKFAA